MIHSASASSLPSHQTPKRLTLVQQQSLASAAASVRPHSMSMSAADGSPLGVGYNPYLLAESTLPMAAGATGSGTSGTPQFRKTKNLEQRLAEYLKPPRAGAKTAGSGNGDTPASPDKEKSNISVNVLLHPKSPLGSLNSPTGANFGTVGGDILARSAAAAAASSAAGKEEKEGSGTAPSSPQMGPRARKAAADAAAKFAAEAKQEEARAAAQAADLVRSVKKKKHRSAAEEEAAAAALAAAAAASEAATKAAAAAKEAAQAEEDADSSSSSSATPAAMNLRLVLKEKKAQAAAKEQERARDADAKKPWQGITWTEVVQAKMLLSQQAKSRAAAAASGQPPPERDERRNPTQAVQVASALLAAQSGKSGSGKKPFNVYSLTEFQRQEYKTAVEQGKWLNMMAKEDAAPATKSTTTAGSSGNSQVEFLPNENKRVSSKTRVLNLAKGDVVQQSSGSGGSMSSLNNGPGSAPPPGQLLYNTYVSCNGQYGYVRFLGRVAWGTGLWVGMELVEKHSFASTGLANAPWVDFYSEQSAISMQLVEETAEQKAEHKRRVRAANSATGSVADQMAAAAEGGPTSQMMLNTAIPRPLLLAAMLPPPREKAVLGKDGKITSGAGNSLQSSSDAQYQPLSQSIFPFIDVMCFLREGLAACFEMGEVDPGLAYFAPLDSVKRVAQRPKIDSKTLLQHKEQQTNPFADVDELAIQCPKKQEATVEMLARYLTVSDREVLDGERNKARAIFRWICHNIRFDPSGQGGRGHHGGGAGGEGGGAGGAQPNSSTDVISIIRHRRATAEGFALLFHALATAGGLACLRIRGVEKQLNSRTDQVVRQKHAWNAIKIEGEWSLVDCVYSCGQFVESVTRDPKTGQYSGERVFQQMFSDAYFATPPSLFILEHFPSDAFGDAYAKLLPAEYNNLQLLRSVVTAQEFEKGLIPGRAFVEYQMRSSVFSYALECKQPSFQIELTAPAFILFDVELKLKSHIVDLSQCAHVAYDGEQVTIYLIFPVPGEYTCRITCKPNWRELDVYDACLTYKLTSHTGLVPLAANKDVIIGFLQHRKVNARDSRSLFNRHFTLLHPLSGHLIPKAPFVVQLKGPEICDSVVVACNGDWQRLSATSLSKGGGVKLFEGTAVIQPRYELQIFYEMEKKFHLLFFYRANLTSFSNIYLEKDKSAAAAAASAANNAAAQGASGAHPELWHGKCALGLEGRCFDANLSLDVPACRFGKGVCTFIIHCSVAWDVAIQMQEGWRNGTPLPENQVVVEELKNFRTQAMTQYKITTTLPSSAAAHASMERERASSNAGDLPRMSPNNGGGRVRGASFAFDSSNGPASPSLQGLRSSPSGPRGMSGSGAGADLSKLSLSGDSDAPRLSTQFVLVVNCRSIKAGGPMRYALSYYIDTMKTGQNAMANNQQQQLQIEVE